MLQQNNIEGYEVLVYLPENYHSEKKYRLLLVNDGDMLKENIALLFDGIIVGIIPHDRLKEYTPWKEKALRNNAPDFGGDAEKYNSLLENKIIPELEKIYSVDENYIIYMGYSLGGLCAVYSLFTNKVFTHIISACGSFWYPHFDEYVKDNKVINKNAKVYLLNGKNEGSKHNNILSKAPEKAKIVHQLISKQNETISKFDDYGHHEKASERLNYLLSLIK